LGHRSHHLQESSAIRCDRYLRRSYENFYAYPGGISEVLWDPERFPTTGTAQTNFEDALQRAFKAIEANIGDPPKDDRRLLAKLTLHGIDPEEPVGYQEKIPIQEMIRRMNDARDKRAAHGSTRNRGIAIGDLLDFQACAEFIVWSELEHVRGERSNRDPTATSA
jgi:hypothetical protein